MTVDQAAGAAVAIQEIDVLWINAGLSCDGDTIAVTAATQPSIEDLVPGSLPWIPTVNFHNFSCLRKRRRLFGAPASRDWSVGARSQCNFGERDWMSDIGGCPKAVMTYGRAIHARRCFTQASLNKKPSWRGRRGAPA